MENNIRNHANCAHWLFIWPWNGFYAYVVNKLVDNISELAHIIQGEAGVCPLVAMLAVAWIYSRNDTMYGNAKPSNGALFVAKYWQSIPDPVPGKHFIFSKQDLRQARVRQLIKNREPTVFRCRGELKLYAY